MFIRKSKDRGFADHGWLKSNHTFSFAGYYDANHIGFGTLRVINEDRIAGGTGFGTHGHRDMEIISYVIDGALEHKDSMGNSTLIQKGDVQRLSAGTGIQHSEYNHLKDRETHFLQIWIVPQSTGIEPSYDQKNFSQKLTHNGPVLVASQFGKDGSITLNQDTNMYVCKSGQDGEEVFKINNNRKLWIQVVHGDVWVDGNLLNNGDAMGMENVDHIKLKWSAGGEFLIFDMN